MDKHHLHWYLEEMLIHSTAALKNLEVIKALIVDPSKRQTRDVWAAVSGCLGNVAMVSKYLDPVGKTEKAKAKARSTKFKSLLGVEETNSVLNRTSRDNIEHFDERIDGWVHSTKSKIIEMVFDDREGFDYICASDAAVRRVLIEDEFVYISEDKDGKRVEIRLMDVERDIKILRNKCAEWIKNESPYSYVGP